jgi:hypothetical protein
VPYCRAEEMFRKAIETEAHETSYQQLGKVLVIQEDISGALATCHQALMQTPESSDTLCQIGLLYLREGAHRLVSSHSPRECTLLHPAPRSVLFQVHRHTCPIFL